MLKPMQGKAGKSFNNATPPFNGLSAPKLNFGKGYLAKCEVMTSAQLFSFYIMKQKAIAKLL